jgi:hypothetical protein
MRGRFAVLALGAALLLPAIEPKNVTVKGYVLDSACGFTKELKKPISADCARACAKAGSPLVIWGDDGAVYWPTTTAMPAASQNDKLLPFAAQRVTVTGKLYVHGGSKAIEIDKIEPLK